MPGILVLVFWCWFAASIVILARRGIRRSTNRTKQRESRPPVVWPPLHEIDPLPNEVGAAPDAAGSDPAADADAPRKPNVFTREPRVKRDATIAAALDGIRLPCDLAPLTGGGNDFERRAAFFTVGYPAEAVAPGIADELERIGMKFNALSENTAVAKRDDVEVRVAVHAVGPAINGVADLTYPTAPEHSVVVEFELTY
jgi:hypothetical protein